MKEAEKQHNSIDVQETDARLMPSDWGAQGSTGYGGRLVSDLKNFARRKFHFLIMMWRIQKNSARVSGVFCA